MLSPLPEARDAIGDMLHGSDLPDSGGVPGPEVILVTYLDTPKGRDCASFIATVEGAMTREGEPNSRDVTLYMSGNFRDAVHRKPNSEVRRWVESFCPDPQLGDQLLKPQERLQYLLYNTPKWQDRASGAFDPVFPTSIAVGSFENMNLVGDGDRSSGKRIYAWDASGDQGGKSWVLKSALAKNQLFTIRDQTFLALGVLPEKFMDYYQRQGLVVGVFPMGRGAPSGATLTLVGPPLPRVLRKFEEYSAAIGGGTDIRIPSKEAVDQLWRDLKEPGHGTKQSEKPQVPVPETHAWPVAAVAGGGILSVVWYLRRAHESRTKAGKQAGEQAGEQAGIKVRSRVKPRDPLGTPQLDSGTGHANATTLDNGPQRLTNPEDAAATVKSEYPRRRDDIQKYLVNVAHRDVMYMLNHDRPCEAAAVMHAILEMEYIKHFDLEFALKYLNVNPGFVFQKLEAHAKDPDFDKARDASEWLRRLSHYKDELDKQRRLVPCKDEKGRGILGPRRSPGYTSARKSGVSAQALKDTKKSNQPESDSCREIADIFKSAKALAGVGAPGDSLAVVQGADIYIPGVKRPHLHVGKRFVTLSLSDSDHLKLIGGDKPFFENIEKARQDTKCDTRHGEVILAFLDHIQVRDGDLLAWAKAFAKGGSTGGA